MKKTNHTFNAVLVLFLIWPPVAVLLSPSYWNIVFEFPQFQLVALACFIIPVRAIWARKILRNPFFFLPFTCSFVLAAVSKTYPIFLQNYIIFFGFVALIFGLIRTRPPFILLEVKLYMTGIFTTFFEVHNYWRIIVLAMYPFVIPFLWFISVYFAW